MRIEFVDDDSKPRHHKPAIEDGVYEAIVNNVEVRETKKGQYIVVNFLTDKGSILRWYPTRKGERWRLKILLRCFGIEKDQEKNLYSFDTEELIGKKIVITIKDGVVIKTQPYIE